MFIDIYEQALKRCTTSRKVETVRSSPARLSVQQLLNAWLLDSKNGPRRAFKLGWMPEAGSTYQTSLNSVLSGLSGWNECWPHEFPHMYRAHASWSLLTAKRKRAVCQAKHCVGTDLLGQPSTAMEHLAAVRHAGLCGYDQGGHGGWQTFSTHCARACASCSLKNCFYKADCQLTALNL